jgi:hypothetical protein
MLVWALDRNAETGVPVQVRKLASEADREQQFDLGADVHSFAELRGRHVPMNLRVRNSVLQYATSLVESISEARG